MKNNKDRRNFCGVPEVRKIKPISDTLYPFLKAARGNWRNAVYISCETCLYHAAPCGGFLLTVNAEGMPILVEAEKFSAWTGDTVRWEECIGILSCQAFVSLYYEWGLWNLKSDNECSIVQLLSKP